MTREQPLWQQDSDDDESASDHYAGMGYFKYQMFTIRRWLCCCCPTGQGKGKYNPV
jgi:hypothetical protein